MRGIRVLFAASLAIFLIACSTGKKSPSGFRLPEGNAERGKALFLELKCNDCHQVVGTDIPGPGQSVIAPVRLGGELAYHRTDGELVTAIINPSHRLTRGYPKEVVERDGKSRMRDYSDTLTVRELVDLVAFLQTTYTRVIPEPLYYR
jgi:mono/diheme cytochrome c family protein